MGAGTIAVIQAFLIGNAWEEAGCIQSRPARLARHPALVSNPTHIRACIAKLARIRLQIADDLPGILPVIIGFVINGTTLPGPAIVTIAPVGPVEPDFGDRTILR